MRLNRKGRYDAVQAGDESTCTHDVAILCLGAIDNPECEGGRLTVKCFHCGETLEEGMMVE